MLARYYEMRGHEASILPRLTFSAHARHAEVTAAVIGRRDDA